MEEEERGRGKEGEGGRFPGRGEKFVLVAVTDPVWARRANRALEPLVDYINGGALQLPENLTSTYLRKSKRGCEREQRLRVFINVSSRLRRRWIGGAASRELVLHM